MVGTILSDGARIVYEVLPSSATMVIHSEVVMYTAVVEITDIDRERSVRKRLVATGCENNTGKTVFVNMDGSNIEAAVVFEWDKNGDKVFDVLATRVCAAYAAKSKNVLPGTDTRAPTKPKRNGVAT